MRHIVFILWSYLIISCQNSEKTTVVINLDKNISTQSVHLHEWAEDIKWIPLETKEDILLSNRTDYWINDKYIISVDINNIHQFDLEGKHRRKLASSGRGPNEYNHILCFTVDDENDLFYFVHTNDIQSIFCIDINTGEFKEKISTQRLNYPSSMIVSDGNLVCFSGQGFENDTVYTAYTLTSEGELKDTFIEIETDPTSILHFRQRGRPIPGVSNFIEYYKKDTIYKLTYPLPASLFTFKYENRFEEDLNNDGINLIIPFQTSTDYIIIKQKFKLDKNEESFRITSGKTNDFYLLNKKDYIVTKIDESYVYPFENTAYSLNDVCVNGNRIYTAINAYKFKEMYEKLLEENSTTISTELENIYNKINEEDNPVLLIGKLK